MAEEGLTKSGGGWTTRSTGRENPLEQLFASEDHVSTHLFKEGCHLPHQAGGFPWLLNERRYTHPAQSLSHATI